MLLAAAARARPAPTGNEIQELLAALRDGPEGRRDHAAQRLYHLQDPRGNRAVMALARADEPTLKVVGLRALAIVRPRGASKAVSEALRAKDPTVLRAAIDAAGMMRMTGSARRLRRLLRHRNPACRASALRALGRLGAAGLRGLQQALRSPEPQQRLAAVAVLGTMEDKRARRLLRRTAQRATADMALIAARALLAADDAYGYRPLARLLRHPDKNTRLRAIALLTEHKGHPSAHRLLKASTGNADPDVSRSAADALASAKVRNK